MAFNRGRRLSKIQFTILLETQNFSLSHARDNTKNIFPISMATDNFNCKKQKRVVLV